MSAIGTKRTWACALQMSAIGRKSGHDVLHCICPLMTQSGHPSFSALESLSSALPPIFVFSLYGGIF